MSTPTTIHSKKHGPYYLASNVYACELDDGAVFVDLRSSKYFALDATSTRYLRTAVLDWPKAELFPPAHHGENPLLCVIDALRSRNALAPEWSFHHFLPVPKTPTSSCRANWSLRATAPHALLMFWRFSHIYPRVLLATYSNSLLRIFFYLHRQRERYELEVPQFSKLQELVTLFSKVRVWFYTAKEKCLLDSLVLASVLRSYKIHATLHIGVKLMPFSAHAWVQCGSYILDDGLDHIRQYTPLLTT